MINFRYGRARVARSDHYVFALFFVIINIFVAFHRNFVGNLSEMRFNGSYRSTLNEKVHIECLYVLNWSRGFRATGINTTNLHSTRSYQWRIQENISRMDNYIKAIERVDRERRPYKIGVRDSDSFNLFLK